MMDNTKRPTTICIGIPTTKIFNCGIVRVVCERRYHAGAESEEMFMQAGVRLEFMNDEVQKYD